MLEDSGAEVLVVGPGVAQQAATLEGHTRGSRAVNDVLPVAFLRSWWSGSRTAGPRGSRSARGRACSPQPTTSCWPRPGCITRTRCGAAVSMCLPGRRRTTRRGRRAPGAWGSGVPRLPATVSCRSAGEQYRPPRRIFGVPARKSLRDLRETPSPPRDASTTETAAPSPSPPGVRGAGCGAAPPAPTGRSRSRIDGLRLP
jgi:hypothetical protein